MSKNEGYIRTVRLIAKIWSLLSIVFVLTIFIGEALSENGPMPSAQEWVGLAFFPIGVMIGLVLAWRWEGIGGLIAVLSLIAFYIWDFARRGSLAGGPYFLLVAAPGFLFLICWAWSHRKPENRLRGT